jgi:phosphoserine aminotransferase
MARIHNFNAGPAAIPVAVLERAQRELLDFDGTGMSILEHSHRGAAYDRVHNEAISGLRELCGISDAYDILFLQGGASLQFAMLPMNFVADGKSADYVLTGTWSKKALDEAKRIGKARAAADAYVDGRCTQVPDHETLDVDSDAAYLHLTSNNTIFGTQFHSWPDVSVPLVVDMSSDFMWRPMDVDKFDIIYAGTQKNVGPSGMAIVIIKKSMIASAREDIPNILRYAIHASKNSLYNTPNSFAVYMVRNVTQQLLQSGGLAEVGQRNEAKAALLYDLIDSDADFFRGPVAKGSRSAMNVVFNLPSEELEKKFVAEATDAGLNGLKGHRSVGGVRASIYNAVSLESVQALADFMGAFRKRA